MNHEKLRRLILAALFAALTYVATNIIHIPTPATNGYVNLGDCKVLLGAFLLGPLFGAAAGGIGSMLADLLLGYVSYAPGTFLIKGAMAVCAACLFRCLRVHTGSLVASILAGIAAELIMVFGYFFYEAVLLGYGLAAAASIAGNSVQALFGLILGVLLFQSLSRLAVVKRAIGST